MTTQGGDILAWLDAAITRREEAATAASGSHWHVDSWGNVQTDQRETVAEVWPLASLGSNAAFIAANDPDSVLRRCAADRKLLELHAPQQDGSAFPDSLQCRTCSETPGDGYQYLVPFPCPTVLAIAEGYGWTGDER